MTTSLSATGPRVFPVALGCMGLSGVYGATSDDASVALIGNAIDRGITMINTGEFYASGHNELLVGRAIAGRRDNLLQGAPLKAELATITEIGRSLAGYATSAGHVSYAYSRKTRCWGIYWTIG